LMVSVAKEFYHLSDNHSKFEDGTLNYLSIPALKFGLDFISGIGMRLIHDRVRVLTAWLIEGLMKIRHPTTGRRLVRVFGPENTEMRGGTLALGFYDKDGGWICHRLIEMVANHANINVRAGCFCNPGSSEIVLHMIFEPEVRSKNGMTTMLSHFGDDTAWGMVRMSLGLVSNHHDIHRVLQFCRMFTDVEKYNAWSELFWSQFTPPQSIC